MKIKKLKNKIRKFLWGNIISEKIYFIFHGDSMVPPDSMRASVGVTMTASDYKKNGTHIQNLCIELAQLKRDAKILDVGCGVGLTAVPLTNYLTTGSYYGFDIIKKGIDFCNERISSKYPNFTFIHSDILNKHYNNNGKISAAEYKFPCKDETFDFVFLNSVFTHMYPKDMENYLKEISRVLKSGGNCFITFFIMNLESRRLMQEPKSEQNFKYNRDGFSYTKAHDPEAAIAYEEERIVELFESNGMSINNGIKYGSWCGRDNCIYFQDIVVATKK